MTDADTQTPAARGDDPDLRAAVRALVAEIEQLRRARAEDEAQTRRNFAQLAAELQRLAEPPTPDGPPPRAFTWLDAGGDRGDLGQVLSQLVRWLRDVYLRYTDAREHFPECWLWHPEVVEELIWLGDAWSAAYGPGAPLHAAGDWHDRQRPGVVRRIKTYAGTCSLDLHREGGAAARPAMEPPFATAIVATAEWWATARNDVAPAPTHAQLDRGWGRR